MDGVLVDANSSEKPVEIRVAKGIYKPDEGAGIIPGEREATFQLISGITLKGGYAGFGESNPNVRDIELYRTILNGDLADNDTPVPVDDPYYLYEDPSRADNSLCVVTAIRADPNTVIEGVFITGAYFYYPEELDYEGAGLYVGSHANITVSKCVFANNAAPGVYCSASDPNIVDCVFERNLRGGIYIYSGSPQVIRCNFEDNWAENGGGLYNNTGCFYLENCTFTRNVASGLWLADNGCGGGLCSTDSYQAGSKIINCVFADNIASSGGGMHLGHMGMLPPSSRHDEIILLSGCTFVNNKAMDGGAISQSLSSINVEYCVFRMNQAVHNRGGAILNMSSFTNLSNCIFSGNSASDRGASIYARDNQVTSPRGDKLLLEFILTLNNCTFRGNFSPVGRTLSCESDHTKGLDKVIISDCILWNDGDEINQYSQHREELPDVTIMHSNIQSNWPGEGNINEDPLFVNPGYWVDANDPNQIAEPNDPDAVWVDGDYHLKSQAGRWDSNNQSWVIDDITSPGIDAGDPNSPIGLEPFPNGGRINMGAYGGTIEASKSYFGEPLCDTIIAGDINGDCKVDFEDFAIMASHWLECTAPECDLDQQPPPNNMPGSVSMPNPAAIYCHALGYKSKIVTDEEGNQYGVCIFPDGSECGEWDFYRGKCGQEWSYCNLHGYDLKELGRYEGWFKGAICIDKTTKEEIGTVFDLFMGEFLSWSLPYPVGDLNQDCRVNLLDFAIMALHWLEER